MFTVNTGQARTDLYGIGKGLAQVIDLSPTRRANELAVAHEERKKAQEQERDGKLISDISALDKGQIRPNDLSYFADKQKGIYDMAKQKFAKGELTINDQVELESAISNLKQEALVSGARKAQVTELMKQAILHPDKYNRKEEVDALQQELYHPDKSAANGGLQNTIPTLTEHNDYNQYINEKLAPEAERQAKMVNNQGYYENTPDQRKQLIIDSLVDPARHEQASYDFNGATDKLGASNPTDYRVAQYADRLKVSNKPKQSEWQVYGQPGTKEPVLPPVTHTLTDDGEEVHIKDQKSGQELDVFKNKNGDITGGIIGGRLTPDEKTLRDKAISENDARKRVYDKAVAAGEIKPPFEESFIPFKDKNIILSPKEAQTQFHDNFGGIDVKDVFNGKAKANIQKVDAKTKVKIVPKEGDKKTFTQGPATFVNGKWALDK